MTRLHRKPKDPEAALRNLRARIRGGSRPQLGTLHKDEMVAAHQLISKGEAEIAYYSCNLFLVAKRNEVARELADKLTAREPTKHNKD